MQYCFAIAKSGTADTKPFFRDFKNNLNTVFNLSTLWYVEFLENQLIDKIRKNRNEAGYGRLLPFTQTEAIEMQTWTIKFFQQWISAKL